MVEEATRYVRYLAWLSAVPTGQKQTRREAYGEDSVASPPIIAQWLVEAAAQCGLAVSSGFGAAAVSWQEVQAWATTTGQRGRWLCITVRDLSLAYVKEYREASDPARPSPLVEVDLQEQRKTVMNQLQRFLRNRR